MFALAAVYGHPEAARICYFMLAQMQSRMKTHERCCAIVTRDGKDRVFERGGRGTVLEVFNNEMLEELPGRIAIGVGGTSPLAFSISNVPNVPLVMAGSRDASVWASIMIEKKHSWNRGSLIRLLRERPGIFATALISQETLFVSRDPWGFIPLSMAEFRYNRCQGVAIASESCAFWVEGEDKGAEFESSREIVPGYGITVLGDKSVQVEHWELACPHQPKYACSYGQLYILHPSSAANGLSPALTRIEVGKRLATKFLAKRAMPPDTAVVPAPDSGTHVAEGVCEALGFPAPLQGIIRHHYLHSSLPRVFRIKYTVSEKAVRGKNVLLADDSLIEGKVGKFLISELRAKGAVSVHLLAGVALKQNCPANLALHNKFDFLAATLSPDQICENVGADSFTVLSAEEIQEILGENFCCHCMGISNPVLARL